jgi:hypothetical protein
MSTLLGLQQEPLVEAATFSDELVRRQVWSILASLFPSPKSIERRSDQRFPFPQLLYLTPVGVDGIPLAGESIVVVGKHLSERGLGFYYQQPLAYRRMIASLELADGRWVGFLVDITWCRFTQHGWYDSGGRFLQAVPSPIG